MPTDAALLTLTQWFSPGYPIGAFSYSHGLEAATAAGLIPDAAALEDWLHETLHSGAGRTDAQFIAAAFNAGEPGLARIDATCRALSPSRERLIETTQQGRAFVTITNATHDLTMPDLCYPVAVGRAAKLCNLPLPLTLQLYLQAMMANIIAAAQRLAPIGQTPAQAVLSRLSAQCPALAETITGDLDDLYSTTLFSDILSMQHETQSPRIFRT